MGNIESINDVIHLLDPTTVGILVIVIIIVFVKYHEKISTVLKTYFNGHHDIQEGSKEELFESIRSIQNNMNEINNNQSQIITNQLELSNGLRELQDKWNTWKSDADTKLSGIVTQQEFLVDADLEDRKAYIVNAYNYYVNRLGLIDMRSKETIEKSYEIYLKEGGDTFVAGLMTKLRTIPVIPELTKEILDSKLGPNGSIYQDDTLLRK